jgi:murein DD-endopeptidase MepM/ murein hydrolase activator NlpD
VDLAAPLGSPVAAALPGRVSTAGWAGGYGYMVVVQHGNGFETRYAHLSSISVVAGQQIQRGQTVGLVGSTGRSTGPHLHYELRQNGRPLNPLTR